MDTLSFRSRFKQGQQYDPDSKNDIFKPHSTKKNSKMNSFKFAINKINLKVIVISLVCWGLVINYYERSVVRRTIKQCSWTKWEDWKAGDPHRIALFADPQIMDAYSYPGRSNIVNFFARQLIDNYHKRNWAYVQDVLDADTTIFLGDLFDGGRNWEDEEWYEEFERFNSIYYRPPNKRTIMSLPGNHDIGFGETVNVTSLQRFKAAFGPTSSTHHIGNHTIVLLDTISLSDFSNNEVTKHPRSVLESLAPYSANESPRILMSHVPLYRFPDQQPCGPLRESKKKFPIMKGDQYQTVIEYELSKEILNKIRPKVAFSGDDHDYCQVTHTYQVDGKDVNADEITVKSCSMNMGIQYPAIQLLSLNTEDKSNTQTFKTQICYLPAPYTALKSYVSALIINLIVFLVIFLLPKLWRKITDQLTRLVTHNNYASLPVAEHLVKPTAIIYERDWFGLGINAGLVVIGALFIFSLYFNAF